MSSSSSSKISSGLSLSTNYYMRNFYNANTGAYKTSTRKKYSKLELNYEDSRALKRASGKLSKASYTESDNSETIANSVEAYVKTYNNALGSAKSDRSMRRYATQLKQLAKTHESELEEIGVTVEKDGSMKVNSNLLKCADPEAVGKLFSEKSDFARESKAVSRKMNSATYNQIYSRMTGTGMKINIVL